MKFKIGDELVCYSVCRMRDNGHRVITKYKVYPIIGFHDNNMLLCIKDDDGDCHYWSIIKGSASYYGEYFWTAREYKLKLINQTIKN